MNEKLREDVLQAYEERAKRWNQQDPRDRYTYMTAKVAADHRLLNKIDLSAKSVLNIGCAFLIDEICFARKVKRWTAVDFSPQSIQSARQIIEAELPLQLAQKIQLSVADAMKLPFASGSFDVTVSFSTIDHVPGHENRQQVIAEMARVIRKGGYVIITVPNRLNYLYYSRSLKKQCDQTAGYGYEYCFTPVELKRMCVKVGLSPMFFASSFALPDVDFSLSPPYQRPLLRGAFALLGPMQFLGRRMGYLCVK